MRGHIDLTAINVAQGESLCVSGITPRRHIERVDRVVCPHCGKVRAVDWFMATSDACWKCRGIRPELRENKDPQADAEALRDEVRRKLRTEGHL